MSFGELKKLEVERVRLQAELTALQESMPTKAAMEDMAAFIARTPEPLVPAVAGAGAGASPSGADGGAGAVPTAGGAAAASSTAAAPAATSAATAAAAAAAAATATAPNPWTAAPEASYFLSCPALPCSPPCLPVARCSIA